MSSRAGLALSKGLSLVCALAVVACLLPRSAAAQAVTGTLLGTVTDSTGAVLPGATVTATNTDTGFNRTVTADTSGEYAIPSIPTGTYTVAGELSGFKGIQMSNIRVGVDQRVRIDLRLEVGDMTESITIEATTPLVQASSSDLSVTVSEDEIKTLPLNGRNFVSLTRGIPGVLRGNPGANIDGAGSLAWRASASFSANGQRARDNNYMLDGVDNNETWLQTVVIFPSVDALDEVKLQTSTYSAEFGRSLGGVVNLQIKSGSNQYRGSAYEFYRNDGLDANNFFNNRNNRDKPDFRQDQFGGTFGGAIFKDRTFFFGDYQGMRISQGQTYLSTVPTELMRAGNFSQVNRPIYDPQTGQPFPGNIIPRERWDPAARNIIDELYPAPNATGRISTATGQTIDNYLINPTLQREDDQFDVKVDHNLTSNNRFFTRYSYQQTHRFLPATLPFGDAGTTFGAGNGDIDAQGLAFNDTHTFSEKWLNEFRFGWSSVKFNMTSLGAGMNLAERVGIPGINLNDATSAMTQISFSQGGARNLGANGNQPLITNQNDFQLFNNLTRVTGRHTMKFGGSITWRSREILNADQITGGFVFSNLLTSNCTGITSGCTLIPNTGFDVASFVLGLASNKNRRLFDAETYTEKRPEYSLYIQDDFRATQRLTINAGLRWDVYVPWLEVDDRQSNFDTSTGTFVVASPNATMNGVEVGRYLQTYSKTDFGPRFGFAYDVDGTGRTIVRGGWGVFWNFTPGGTSSSKAQNPPFLQATALTADGTYGHNLQLSDGLPPPPGVDPSRPASGATRSIFDINFRDGYAHNFNVNLQRQLGTNYVVEVAYAGSRGRDMMAKVNPNQAPPVPGVTNAEVNRPFITLAPALRNVGQAASIGFVDYNGLLLKFQRRFANNFSFLNSYTFGKAIDINSDNDGDVSFQNVYDIVNNNRGPADYDVTHTFSSSAIYELPWARDQWYGGWQVNGILYLRSGLPFTVTQTQNVLSTGTGNRPDRVCDGRLDNPTIDRWFDTSCFVPPADTTATYGNAGRNILRGPGQFNIDMSLIKRTRIGRFDTEFRVEAFNVLNHPQFAPRPNSQIGNSAVGTITSMLPNPACALCGTTERQIQLAAKLSF
jgi:hypothetical protein